MDKKVGVGLIGSQFVTSIHAESLRTVSDAEVLAVVSPSGTHAEDFAAKHAIPHHFRDVDPMLAMEEIDMVVIGACSKAGVKLMYAEELCFTPKYVRMKALLDEGAAG